MSCKGVDEKGYIKNNIPIENVPILFKNVLEKSIEFLAEELGKDLHSIYLYGSVGRGNATFGQSDLDLSAITYSDLSIKKKRKLKQIEQHICRNHDSISKLELDMGTFEEAMVRNEL